MLLDNIAGKMVECIVGFNYHEVTVFTPYISNRDIVYHRQVVKCKFSPRTAVKLGQVEVQGASSGKMVVFEDDLNMSTYVAPEAFVGVGWTFKPESYVVLGDHISINNVSDLEDRYTIKSVYHNNYSFSLKHHFSLELV